MKYIKENLKFFIIIIIVFLLFFIKLPYYVDTPGEIQNLKERISLNGYNSSGSINLVFVREYRANIPLLILSWVSKDYDLYKAEQVILDKEDYKDYDTRDQILMDESISNAIYVAYNYADKNIKITDTSIKVLFVVSESNTDLKVGDKIVSINNKKILNNQDISDIVNKSNVGEKLTINVVDKNNNNKNRYAYVIDENGENKIGIGVSEIHKYDTIPKISIERKKNESGSSGGLAMALQIYNSLIEKDITGGLTIVCTGTIKKDGTVGSIGGVEFKLKSAVKNKADLFIVPNDNYDAAIKYKNKNNYKIKIVGVSNFREALNYLKESA